MTGKVVPIECRAYEALPTWQRRLERQAITRAPAVSDGRDQRLTTRAMAAGEG